MKTSGRASKTALHERTYSSFKTSFRQLTCPTCGYKTKAKPGITYVCGKCIEKDAIEMIWEEKS